MNIGQSDAVTIGEYNEQGELMRGYYYSPQNSLGNAPVAIKHNDNGITQTNTQVSNPLRFPGQYQDDETGLHYNWHRYYDNSIGRYVTRDPIGLGGGLNTFGYVLANPLMYFDANGKEPRSTVGGDDEAFESEEARQRAIREQDRIINDPGSKQKEKSKAKRRKRELQRRPSRNQQHHKEGANFCEDYPKTCVTGAVIVVGGLVVGGFCLAGPLGAGADAGLGMSLQ